MSESLVMDALSPIWTIDVVMPGFGTKTGGREGEEV